MTDRDTPVTALREAVAAYIDALDDGAHPERVVPSLRALRAALASSDDVAGSGERLALEQMRREHADHTTEFRCAGCAALLRVDAAAPTTEAPPRDAPE
jgi:hypothetical protein